MASNNPPLVSSLASEELSPPWTKCTIQMQIKCGFSKFAERCSSVSGFPYALVLCSMFCTSTVLRMIIVDTLNFKFDEISAFKRPINSVAILLIHDCNLDCSYICSPRTFNKTLSTIPRNFSSRAFLAASVFSSGVIISDYLDRCLLVFYFEVDFS